MSFRFSCVTYRRGLEASSKSYWHNLVRVECLQMIKPVLVAFCRLKLLRVNDVRFENTCRVSEDSNVSRVVYKTLRFLCFIEHHNVVVMTSVCETDISGWIPTDYQFQIFCSIKFVFRNSEWCMKFGDPSSEFRHRRSEFDNR